MEISATFLSYVLPTIPWHMALVADTGEIPVGDTRPFNVDKAIEKSTNRCLPLEVVGLLAPSHLTPDSNAARKQLPKDLPRLRGMGLCERGPVREIAAQLLLDARRVERGHGQTVEHGQFRAQARALVLMLPDF